MPDAELWPEDIDKVDTAARYLQDRMITSCAHNERKHKPKLKPALHLNDLTQAKHFNSKDRGIMFL
jgi:hypothetical protein